MTPTPSQPLAPQAEFWIRDFLRGLKSLLVAILDSQGHLIDANRGFRELFPSTSDGPNPGQVRSVFLNPSLGQLLDRAEGEHNEALFSGLMTLGAMDGESETWLGSVYRQGDRLLLVAERDVDQDRNLQRQLLALNKDYAEQERKLIRANRELARHAREVERLTYTDLLTELPNRRYFDSILRHQIENADRYGEVFSVLIVDLDRFKAINDSYGHLQGDEVLKQVAGALRNSLRSSDVIARWGGEEFIALAPKTGLESAQGLAERIRAKVEGMKVSGGPSQVTVSVGVAELKAKESAEGLLSRADQALYRAKELGRNRVTTGSQEDERNEPSFY